MRIVRKTEILTRGSNKLIDMDIDGDATDFGDVNSHILH
jgi:hypothetical protein